MYEGLYNVRKGLSTGDAEAVGVMTAKLLLHWDEWQHRRVEEISFEEDDAATRDISLDFTLPHWFHEIRQTPLDQPKRQLVPLTFLRKQSLINFRLRDDCDCALPLLTRWQNAQVAEATLTVLASMVLGGVAIPHEIRCDGESSVDAAAAILLAVTAIVGLFAGTKDGGTNMVRELLWPVQLLAMTSVLWTFLAGLVILAPLGIEATRLCFGALAFFDLVCTAQLLATGRVVTRPAQAGTI